MWVHAEVLEGWEVEGNDWAQAPGFALLAGELLHPPCLVSLFRALDVVNRPLLAAQVDLHRLSAILLP